MRMFTFGGMLPSFLYNFGGNHAFDELVTREDVTLEEVLEYEGLTEEVRSHNASFEQFLTPDHCNTLLTYITVEPQADADAKRSFKYPFVASEVLSNDLEKVVNMFLKEAAFMERLLGFLRTDRINLTLAGYFAKVYTSLFNRYSHFVMGATFDGSYSKDLVRHVASRSIAEVVERLLSFEDAGSKAYVEERKTLLDLLIDKIAPETEVESINASSIIVNFLGKQTSVVRWEEVASHLASKATLGRLTTHLFSDSTIVLKSLVSVLIAIITYAPLKADTADEDSTLIEPETYPVLELLNDKLELIVGRIKQTRGLTSETTFKATVPVIGEGRLKLCELLVTGLKLSDSSLSKKVIEQRVPRLLVQMFSEYPWNSSYHKVFQSFVNTVLDSSDNALKEALIVEAELPKYLVDISDNERFPTAGVTIRRGNMGFVTQISNVLVKHSKTDFIKQLLSQFPSWDCYVNEALREQNEIESSTIAGHKTNFFSEDQFSEEEDKPIFSDKETNEDEPDLDHEEDFQGNDAPMSTEELDDALFSLTDSPIKTAEVPEESSTDLEFNSNLFWKVADKTDELEDLD